MILILVEISLLISLVHKLNQIQASVEFSSRYSSWKLSGGGQEGRGGGRENRLDECEKGGRGAVVRDGTLLTLYGIDISRDESGTSERTTAGRAEKIIPVLEGVGPAAVLDIGDGF